MSSELSFGREHVPSAELYGFPSLARTNLSSFEKLKRRTASIRSSSSCESPILPLQLEILSHRKWTYAAKMSARSAYCQYSRLGIGSSKEAGRDRRLAMSDLLRWVSREVLHVGHVLDAHKPMSVSFNIQVARRREALLTFLADPSRP